MAVAVAAGLLTAVLGGCDRKPAAALAADAGCTSPSAQAVIADLIRDQLEKGAVLDLRDEDGTLLASRSSIRAAVAQISVTLNDIRTSREDPDSTKRFCTAVLRMGFPSQNLAEAELALETTGSQSLSELADAQNIDRAANVFSTELDFAVQPTDDRQKIFGELEDADSTLAFFKDVVVAHLASADIQNAQSAAAREQAEQARLESEASAAANAVTLADAKAEYGLAEQLINATWQNIDAETRSTLLTAQRAWIKRKAADCNLEAAGYSTDPTEREASRLSCDTRLTTERTQQLQRFVGAEPALETTLTPQYTAQ